LNKLVVAQPFPVERLRKDFPILSLKMNGRPLVYLDNASTTQKPRVVIDAVKSYYEKENANIHRGVHRLSADVTMAYENARKTIRKFINAEKEEEVVFTKGTTESINLVASSFGKKFISAGDEILISEMEHHSNILPWQLLCEEKAAVLKVVPINDKGELIIEEFCKLISRRTKLIALVHVSNTLGTINPVKELIAMARKAGSPIKGEEGREIAILIDGAQAVPHMKVDVQDLDCDFYCFSSHKMYGPSGVGVLYGKEKWLKALPPYQAGGGTIKKVTFAKTIYADLPLKFEAGTPPIEGGIGLGTAIGYINGVGLDEIEAYEHELLVYATDKLLQIKGLRIIGNAGKKASVLSFVIEGLHPLDIGTLLDQMGIAVRTGHHCTQPLMDRFGIPGTVRASFAFYNTFEEIDRLADGINKAIKMLC
jgi:cysteine desulfurase/selenocysteine lyase